MGNQITEFPHFFKSPADYQLQYQEVVIKTNDNKTINGYYIPAHRQIDVHINNYEQPFYQPMINKHIAQDIKNQIKMSQISHHIGSSSLQQPSEISDDGDSNDNNDHDDNTTDDDILEFVTPSAQKLHNRSVPIRGKNGKKQRQKAQESTHFLTFCRKYTEELYDMLFRSTPLIDKIASPQSTYDIFDIVNNEKYHVDEDIPTLFLLHGNAGTINHRLPSLFHLVCSLGVNCFIIDYRGYGRSSEMHDGDMNEPGLILDAIAGYCYLQQRVDLNPNLIYLHGQSLGGAVSIALCAAIEKTSENINKSIAEQKCTNDDHNIVPGRVKKFIFNLNDADTDFINVVAPILTKNIIYPKGLLLENTFSSIFDLVDSLFPFLSPIKQYLLKLKWFSDQRIQLIRKIPILFIQSAKDSLIPPSHMQKLYELTNTSYKSLYTVENADHNNAFYIGGANYITEIKKFMNTTVEIIQKNNPSQFNQLRYFQSSNRHIESTLDYLLSVLVRTGAQ